MLNKVKPCMHITLNEPAMSEHMGKGAAVQRTFIKQQHSNTLWLTTESSLFVVS